MGKGKDLKQIKELLFGEEMKLLETRFDHFVNRLEKFERALQKQDQVLSQAVEAIDQTQKTQELLHERITHQKNKLKSYRNDTKIEMTKLQKNIQEELKILKSEIVLMIEKRFQTLHQNKLSHEDMATLFTLVAEELSSKSAEKKNKHSRP